MLGKHPPIGQGLVLTSLEVVASGLVVFHADSMAPLGGVWGVEWTVPQLSHAVEEVVQRLPIFCLSLEDSPMDLPRIGGRGGGRLAGFLALGEDLLHVGVVCHAVSLVGQGWSLGASVDTPYTVTGSPDPVGSCHPCESERRRTHQHGWRAGAAPLLGWRSRWTPRGQRGRRR